MLVAFALLAAAASWYFEGFLELWFAAAVGAIVTLLLIGWYIGFDVHSLPWLWGHLGERWTEDELARLDDEWLIEHDVPRERGNWDHIVVGPPCRRPSTGTWIATKCATRSSGNKRAAPAHGTWVRRIKSRDAASRTQAGSRISS